MSNENVVDIARLCNEVQVVAVSEKTDNYRIPNALYLKFSDGARLYITAHPVPDSPGESWLDIEIRKPPTDEIDWRKLSGYLE